MRSPLPSAAAAVRWRSGRSTAQPARQLEASSGAGLPRIKPTIEWQHCPFSGLGMVAFSLSCFWLCPSNWVSEVCREGALLEGKGGDRPRVPDGGLFERLLPVQQHPVWLHWPPPACLATMTHVFEWCVCQKGLIFDAMDRRLRTCWGRHPPPVRPSLPV